MRGIYPILRLMAVAALDLWTWGLHPSSPYTAKAVIRRNHLTTPI